MSPFISSSLEELLKWILLFIPERSWVQVSGSIFPEAKSDPLEGLNTTVYTKSSALHSCLNAKQLDKRTIRWEHCLLNHGYAKIRSRVKMSKTLQIIVMVYLQNVVEISRSTRNVFRGNIFSLFTLARFELARLKKIQYLKYFGDL